MSASPNGGGRVGARIFAQEAIGSVEVLAGFLVPVHPDDDPIFPDAYGKPHRPRSAELLRDDLGAAGLSKQYKGADLDTRVFRRSFATWLEAHGVPGEHIDRLLGHSE